MIIKHFGDYPKCVITVPRSEATPAPLGGATPALPPLKGPCRLLHHQRFRQKHRHPVEEFHLGQALHMRDNRRLGVDEVRGIDAK